MMMGVKVLDSAYDASMANTTASPSGVKRNFAGPSRNTTDVNTQLIASVETMVGTAMLAGPYRVAAARLIPSPRSRWVFSIVTVESSTRMPTASAMPPRVIVLRVSPRKCRTTMDARIDRGIEIKKIDDGQPGRRRLTRDLQDLADAVHDRDRRGIAVLDDAHQDRATPVRANDVLLNRPAVVHLPDIPQKHCLPIDIFDRNVVEVDDGRRHRIGAHRVLRVADLGETRRQCQALGVDRVHHVQRSQALGLELDRVDIDHDLPELAPIRSRHGNAVHRGELLAQVVQSVIVELLFIE